MRQPIVNGEFVTPVKGTTPIAFTPPRGAIYRFSTRATTHSYSIEVLKIGQNAGARHFLRVFYDLNFKRSERPFLKILLLL